MNLLPGIYQVGGPSRSHFFDATAYLLPAGEELYMIDCGTPQGFDKILENIRSLGFDPAKITRIYATHGHYDHVGAAHLFREAFGTKLYIHPIDRVQVEEGNSVLTSASLLYGVESVPTVVDGVFEEGDSFRVDAGEISILHTPGHTMGSCCFILAHEQAGMCMLFAGDTLHGGFSEKIGSSESAWRESLAKLTARHFDCMTFGHCPPSLLCDADTRIRSLAQSFANYYMPWFKDFYRTYPY